MNANRIDKKTMRRHIYMAHVAEHIEKDLHDNWTFNLEPLGNPMDPKVQAELDRQASDLIKKAKAGDQDLQNMLEASTSGAAWFRSIMTAAATMKEVEAQPPGSDGLVDIMLKHIDITDSIITPPVRGAMIPERLLGGLSFKGAELASVNGILPKDLIAAVMERIEHINPNHPVKRLVAHVSLFLSMIAASPRDAENAINMASAFLARFRDEETMADIAMAMEEAVDASELQRCWILQLMTTARFRMANADIVISLRPNLLTLVEVTDGVVKKGAATISVPLDGYEGGSGRDKLNGSSTQH